jgi:hypothetical protein
MCDPEKVIIAAPRAHRAASPIDLTPLPTYNPAFLFVLLRGATR